METTHVEGPVCLGITRNGCSPVAMDQVTTGRCIGGLGLKIFGWDSRKKLAFVRYGAAVGKVPPCDASNRRMAKPEAVIASVSDLGLESLPRFIIFRGRQRNFTDAEGETKPCTNLVQVPPAYRRACAVPPLRLSATHPP